MRSTLKQRNCQQLDPSNILLKVVPFNLSLPLFPLGDHYHHHFVKIYIKYTKSISFYISIANTSIRFIIMSPTKPRPTITKRIIPPASTTVSFIPRRVKPASSNLQKPISTSSSATSSVTTDPKKKNVSSKEYSKPLSKNVSIFSDLTRTLAPAKPIEYFPKSAEANKENMPVTGRTSYSASYNRANNGGSPIRTRCEYFVIVLPFFYIYAVIRCWGLDEASPNWILTISHVIVYIYIV